MEYLKEKSIAIIKKYQDQNGAYVACPNFPNYYFCWLRDGTFTAYGLDRVGEHDSARRFYHWVDRRIKENEHLIKSLPDKLAAGTELSEKDLLPTRYTLDGKINQDDWQNFQLDGYGTWLWGLAEHIKLTGDQFLVAEFAAGVELTVKYLELCWQMPCFDCWEEHPDQVHASTLACIYGGVKSMAALFKNEAWEGLADAIKEFIINNFIQEGRLVKKTGSEGVDANLLWVCVPFGVLASEDPIIRETVAAIEQDLYHQGVHRYGADTYYGGGEWPLLTAWLGWYYLRAGSREAAEKILVDLENLADEAGELPEQVNLHLNDAAFYPQWVERWGPVAKPLLWAHGMYLILWAELRKPE
jgi:GH15 family glucan-1,4-alpha-glucosidase